MEVAERLKSAASQEYEVLQSSCERLRGQLMELTADVAKHEEKQRTLKAQVADLSAELNTKQAALAEAKAKLAAAEASLKSTK